ncbi:hypothetical protein TNIN_338311 [Trichonephila inaurata madagascariensis]|uniref:Integrase catalytic domain-containing protein n=1 Tax=Trichonephila inaurata madagascariensis TaxID=2747483 RepID=A0A8X6WSF2_9ARAC|nr:hypothetical protein TNIN_338311 [Trichonephila inaurata madagascariensis]
MNSNHSYHPSNGMVERLHRTLNKLFGVTIQKRTESLPVVLLGLRAASRRTQCILRWEKVFLEKTLVLPGEFLEPSSQTQLIPPSFFLG